MIEPNDRELDQYLKGDSALSRSYREASRETAPPQLDETVLALARAESRRKVRPSPWFTGLALAASLVLGVNLAWNIRQARPLAVSEELESPAAESARPPVTPQPEVQMKAEPASPAAPSPAPLQRSAAPPLDAFSADDTAGSAGATAAYERRDEMAAKRRTAQESERSASMNLSAQEQRQQTLAAAPSEQAASAPDVAKLSHGWGLSAGGSDYGIGLANYRPHSGNNSLTLQSKSAQPRSGYGALRQRIPAAAFRGQPVLFEAWLRTQAVSDFAEMWLRIDDASQRELKIANMHDRPIRGDQEWSAHYLILDVPPEAAWINFGVALHGTGHVWVDTVRIESLSPDAAANAASARFYDFEERQLER